MISIQGLTAYLHGNGPILLQAFGETVYMVVVAVVFAYLLGLPLGVILVVTGQRHILSNRPLNMVIGAVVNLFRSVPFIILMVALIPFTRLVVGTSLGTTASIVPLVVGAAPFVARVVETSLNEVDRGVVEAALAMGASNWQIITRVLLPEAMPGLISGLTITAITLVGYSAMAGVIGGGGVGTLAINYGYYGFQTGIMIITVIILIVLVQAIQSLGDWLTYRVNKK